MKNFIDPRQLPELNQPILIDVRTDPAAYGASHIAGAYYLHLEKDLSGVVDEFSGNHPLPEIEDFKKKLEAMGGRNDSVFVIYDGGDNFTAGRAWWLLKYFGLESVFVLNGGFNQALQSGISMSNEVPPPKPGKLVLTGGHMPTTEYEDVLTYSQNPKPGEVLIDSRSHDRYIGKSEPLYATAGHIPNAKHLFYLDPYHPDGTIKAPEELEALFRKFSGQEITLSCGSGVTACSNLIAMDEIGLSPALYVGSYSQWLKRGNAVARGEE